MVSYLLWCPGALSDILAILEPVQDLFNGILLLLGLLDLETLTAHAGLLLLVLEGLLDELNILESQLLGNDVEISAGVHVTLNVDNLGVIEATHDLEDGVDGSDVRQESVTKTSTSRCTSCETSDIVDRQVGGDARLGVVLLAEPVISLVGHNDTSLFGVNGSVGKVLREAVSAGVLEWSSAKIFFLNVRRGYQGCTW